MRKRLNETSCRLKRPCGRIYSSVNDSNDKLQADAENAVSNTRSQIGGAGKEMNAMAFGDKVGQVTKRTASHHCISVIVHNLQGRGSFP